MNKSKNLLRKKSKDYKKLHLLMNYSELVPLMRLA